MRSKEAMIPGPKCSFTSKISDFCSVLPLRTPAKHRKCVDEDIFKGGMCH